MSNLVKIKALFITNNYWKYIYTITIIITFLYSYYNIFYLYIIIGQISGRLRLPINALFLHYGGGKISKRQNILYLA